MLMCYFWFNNTLWTDVCQACNLYQIFTYVKNKETEFGDEPHQVSGMLLYAATDEVIQPDNVYQIR